MTMTMPPNTPGSRRVIPANLRPDEVERLRWLLNQDERWVLRPDWLPYLRSARKDGVDIASLPRGHRIAARAWLAQQRHPLYRAVEGGEAAPDGWLESLPLYEALSD